MMFYWLMGSIGLFLLSFIYGIFYFLQTHFLVRATLAFPGINAEIGNPRSIADISLRHNTECYEAFKVFCDNERYLDADIASTSLASCFARLEKTKKNGKWIMLITLTNFVVCLMALTFSYNCNID